MSVCASGFTPGSSRKPLYCAARRRTARHLFRLHDADRAQQLGALIAHRVRFEDGRRLHRDRRHHLQQVILDHVAQRAGFLVVRAAAFDADRFRGRDLHVVDVAPVPQRLEDAVAEAEGQDVLHRLLAQVVIDAVDLALGKDLPADARFSSLRARQVVAERLLDDDAPPAAASAAFRSGCAEAVRPPSRSGWAAWRGRTARCAVRSRADLRRERRCTAPDPSCRPRCSGCCARSAPTASSSNSVSSLNSFTDSRIFSRNSSSVIGVRELPMIAKRCRAAAGHAPAGTAPAGACVWSGRRSRRRSQWRTPERAVRTATDPQRGSRNSVICFTLLDILGLPASGIKLGESKKVLAVLEDLFFTVKINESAKRAGIAHRVRQERSRRAGQGQAAPVAHHDRHELS